MQTMSPQSSRIWAPIRVSLDLEARTARDGCHERCGVRVSVRCARVSVTQERGIRRRGEHQEFLLEEGALRVAHSDVEVVHPLKDGAACFWYGLCRAEAVAVPFQGYDGIWCRTFSCMLHSNA
jgi:hypothetical protein